MGGVEWWLWDTLPSYLFVLLCLLLYFLPSALVGVSARVKEEDGLWSGLGWYWV